MFQQGTPYPLAPPWKVILLSDGSVTRHLQLMTDQRVEASCWGWRRAWACTPQLAACRPARPVLALCLLCARACCWSLLLGAAARCKAGPAVGRAMALTRCTHSLH